MKRLLLYLAFCGALLCSAGCEPPEPPAPGPDPHGQTDPDTPDKPDKPGDPDTPVTPDPTPYFKADMKDVYPFNRGEQAVWIYFDTNVKDWTATPDADWCTVSYNEDHNGCLVKVGQYDPRYDNGAYMYTSPRTCSVTVKAGDLYNKAFTVLQESMTYIKVPENPVVLSAAGESADITLSNNCYGLSFSETSWLSFTKKDSNTYTVTSTSRPSGDRTARKVTVKVTSVLDNTVYASFVVADADATLSDEDYRYGDHTDWD